MKKNRLQLDFSLRTNEERSHYIDNYLPTLSNPTDAELETISNYLLWGKDPITDLNTIEEGLVLEPSTSTIWKSRKIESLDELLENPKFLESSLSNPTPYSRKRLPAFDRQKARSLASPAALTALETLWERIDSLEFEIALRENKTPRPILFERLSPSHLDTIQSTLLTTPSKDLRLMRRELYALRVDQYVIQDSYSQPIGPRHQTPRLQPHSTPSLQTLPFPLLDLQTHPFYTPTRNLNPANFTEQQLSALNDILFTPFDPTLHYLDLTDPSILQALLSTLPSLPTTSTPSLQSLSSPSGLSSLSPTIQFFLRQVSLPPPWRVVLEGKIHGLSNKEIAELTLHQTNQRYYPNYISTLYLHRILPRIIASIELHYRSVCALFYPELWKTCRTCGKTLLRDPQNYSTLRSRPDGLATQCKQCANAVSKGVKNG